MAVPFLIIDFALKIVRIPATSPRMISVPAGTVSYKVNYKAFSDNYNYFFHALRKCFPTSCGASTPLRRARSFGIDKTHEIIYYNTCYITIVM